MMDAGTSKSKSATSRFFFFFYACALIIGVEGSMPSIHRRCDGHEHPPPRVAVILLLILLLSGIISYVFISVMLFELSAWADHSIPKTN